MAKATLTERLADHVLDVRYETLPAAAVEMAKHVTLDGLAVILAGATEPLGVGRISIEYAREMGGAPQASVIAGGFFDTFLNGNAQPELLVEGFGRPFRMVDPGVGFKKHPSNYFTHRPIDAALALREEHKLDPRDLDHAEIRFPRFDYVNRPRPRTGLDGKFSVQYTTTVALLDGEVTIDSFTNERRFASDVEALLPRVKLEVDDAIPADFDQMHAIVNVTTKGGAHHSRKVDKLSGWVGEPLTRDQRMRKFYSCSRRVLDAAAAERLAELVERLEHQPYVAAIMDIARGDGGGRPLETKEQHRQD